MPQGKPADPPRRGFGALAVASGIFLSRIAGLVRERAIAHFLGTSAAAGALRAALRIPNVLQNLLGEGVLSASFIPVYARLRAEGKHEEARRVAHVVGSLLALVAALVSAVGVLAAAPLVDLLAPGFPDDKRDLTISLVRVVFPGMALLVMSAWCLGVLNSHKRFFLSYVSPVLWNAAIIGAGIVAAGRALGGMDEIAVWFAWGAVIGSAAQFLVQLPTVLSLLRGFRPSIALRAHGVGETVRAFGTVLVGRGSVQISGFIDLAISSYLGATIVAAMAPAQTLALLPVSLFGMAVSAAELPEMASVTGASDERANAIRTRLASALRKVTFFVVPSAVAFVAIGGSIIALLFQSGQFGAHDTKIVWIILAGSALGLLAGTQGRVLSSALYALQEPGKPMRAALVRVVITSVLGYLFALPLRRELGYSPVWGAFALTAGSSLAAWVEYALLAYWLRKRTGPVGVPVRLMFVTLIIAVIAGAAGYGVAHVASSAGMRAWLSGILAIGTFGAVYLGGAMVARIPEVNGITRRIIRRRG